MLKIVQAPGSKGHAPVLDLRQARSTSIEFGGSRPRVLEAIDHCARHANP
jgi:hypothetical protein